MESETMRTPVENTIGWVNWPRLPLILYKRYRQLKENTWKVMIEMDDDYEIETWIWIKQKDGDKYKTISANGKETMRTEAELRRTFERCIMHGGLELGINYFPDEIVPSIVSYYQHEMVLRWQTQWSVLYSQWSTTLWYEMKCHECKTIRRLSLKHWMIVHEHIPVEKRHCSLLGLTCGKLSTRIMELKWELAKRLWIEQIEIGTQSRRSNPSVIVDLHDTGYPHRQLTGVEQVNDWYQMEDEQCDQNTLNVLKALGKQGFSIRPYNETGGITVPRGWMDSIQRHLWLFNIRGGMNQVMVAVCFLEGRAREWWDKACTTGMNQEVNDMDQLYKAL